MSSDARVSPGRKPRPLPCSSRGESCSLSPSSVYMLLPPGSQKAPQCPQSPLSLPSLCPKWAVWLLLTSCDLMPCEHPRGCGQARCVTCPQLLAQAPSPALPSVGVFVGTRVGLRKWLS